MSSPTPTPLQSFLGGVGLSLPVHVLLVMNGNIFGISGFLHRAVRGGKEAAGAVAGLVLGGISVGLIEGVGPKTVAAGLPRVLLSGLLVGVGTKMSNGCTSGHMLCGISRFSRRSIVATATFFSTGVIATRVFNSNMLPTVGTFDWTLGTTTKALLILQIIPLAISTVLYLFTPVSQQSSEDDSKHSEPQSSLRLLATFCTGFNFAIALCLSHLSDPTKVLSFLLLPFHPGFDPSLGFLALGAIPLAALLYRFCRGDERPRLGGPWVVPKRGEIDARLLSGAGIFGVGWGMSGLCPGPGVVNFGRALSSGSDVTQVASWLGAVILGGLLV